MYADEAAEALNVARTFDPREWTITDGVARAWALALSTAVITADEFNAAVVEFYTDPGRAGLRITPADVIARAQVYRAQEARERQAEEHRLRHAPYPGGITNEDIREGRAEIPAGYPPPPSGGTIRDRSEDLVRLMSGIKVTDGDGNARLVRDDPELLHALLEHYRVAPDGHERWSLIGDRSMRRTSGTQLTPAAREAAEEASRAKARAIVAESRARQRGEATDA